MMRVIAAAPAILLLFLLSPASSPGDLPAMDELAADSPFTPHSSIFIVGNNNFTPENGVVGGQGTPTDPYIIEGWEIDAHFYYAISISRTDVFFTLRNLLIRGAVSLAWLQNGRMEETVFQRSGVFCFSCEDTEFSQIEGTEDDFVLSFQRSNRITADRNSVTAIRVRDSSNVNVSNSTILGQQGIELRDSTSITLRSNVLESGGLLLEGGSASHFDTHVIPPDNLLRGKPILYHANCEGLRLTGSLAAQHIVASCQDVHVSNMVIANARAALQMAYVVGSLVEQTELRANEHGILLTGTEDVVLIRNSVEGSSRAIKAIRSSNLNLSQNDLASNEYAIWLEKVSGAVVDSNNVIENSNGLLFFYSNGLVFEDNNVRSNGVGARFSRSTNLSLRGNAFERNVVGVNTYWAQFMDVTGNRFDSNRNGGLLLAGAQFATVQGNVFTSDGIYIRAGSAATHTITEDNTVNGLPLRFYRDCTSLDINGIPTGQLIVTNCQDVSIRNLTVEATHVGILVENAARISIRDSRIAGSSIGIELHALGSVDIRFNEIVDNRGNGLHLRNAGCCARLQGVQLEGNLFSGNRIGGTIPYVEGLLLLNNEFLGNAAYGIRAGGFGRHSEDVNASGNTFVENGVGLALQWFESGTVSENEFRENPSGGLHLARSEGLLISGNQFIADGLRITSPYPEFAHYGSHTITDDNLVNGLPIHIVRDCSDVDLSNTSAGQIFVLNCTNVTISGITLAPTAVAISMAYVQGVVIDNVSLSESAVGIQFVEARDISIDNSEFANDRDAVLMYNTVGARVRTNRITSNQQRGIAVVGSADIDIRHNLISENGKGLELFQADNVTIASNLISRNDIGIFAYGYAQDCPAGCFFLHGDVEIRSNGVRNNRIGVHLGAYEVNVTENDVSENSEVGLSLRLAAAVRVHHNNFRNNPVQAIEERGWGNYWDNEWDIGYPAGGNYWSDYEGDDRCSGIGQDNCPEPDAIGDVPYRTGPRTQDRYPLMEPFRPFGAPPEARFEVSNVDGGSLVSVNASLISDAEDPSFLLEVRWDWQDDGVWDTPWMTDKVAQHEYREPGPVNVRLQVRDTGGLIGEATQQVPIIDGIPPTIIHAPQDATGRPLRILIEAEVDDSSGIAEVLLYYRYGDAGEFTSTEMTSAGEHGYQAEVPRPTVHSSLEYYIVAIDSLGNVARSPASGAYRIEVEREDDLTRPVALGVAAILGLSTVSLIYYLYRRTRRRH